MTEEINPKLLEILACPSCKSDVKLEDGKICCVNSRCLKKFPIREGIPVMLIEEAEDPFKKSDAPASFPNSSIGNL